jgi:predicted oxidoreductase (fatty acid repression mutant protein)
MFYLTFYNDLLEKQNRYEQEIPQKWQAEKQFLDQLRSQIDKVQTEIDTILNSISTS